MRRTPSRLLLLSRQAEALTSTRVCVRGEAEYYKASTRGDFGGDGWVRSGGVTPLSRGVLIRVVSAPASHIGSSSWGWMKISLGLEKSSRTVLTSLCISTISSIRVSRSGIFSKLAGKFLRDSIYSESSSFAP